MARRPAPPIDGVCVVDKPTGWTSHDVVAKARGVLGTRKVGHSGTLDPDATGVLVLGVGRASRLLRFLTALGQSYVGEVVLGTTTSTLDAAGEITGTFDMAGIGLDEVRVVAARFVERSSRSRPWSPPVSYTHLDVYKRQSINSRSGLNSSNFSTSNSAECKVSTDKSAARRMRA